jgi:glycosyltransferase involved in cell wall biosynthesis
VSALAPATDAEADVLPSPATPARRRHVAVFVSRFPHLPETFVLHELEELERLGFTVSLSSLVHHHEAVSQPGSARWAALATFGDELGPARLLGAQLHWLRRRPRAYLSAWGRAVVGNARSPRFLLRALVVVPVAAAFARRCERDGVDRIHAHWATHSGLAAWVAGRLTGLPTTITAHAHDLYVDRSMLGEKLRATEHVVTISDVNRELLEGWYPDLAGRVAVIPCGVDLDGLVPAARAGDRAATAPLRIVTVASLQDYKGHRHLVDALARLTAAGVPVHATFVGEGEERPDLEHRIAAHGLGDVVDLVGAQPHDRVLDLVRGADLVVLPSVVTASGKREGVPVALMEALALEVPVVATAISGIPELVVHGRTGLLVPPADPDALAGAITRIGRDPALARRLAEAGRRHVADRYDRRRNVARLAALFDGSVPPTGPTAPSCAAPGAAPERTT